MSLLARPLRAAVCTVVALSGCLAAGPAAASAGDSCAPGARVLRYVVAFGRGTPEPDAREQLATACGDTTVYYPQIAVAVATSADPGFPAKIGADRAFSAQGTRLAEQRATGADPVRPALAPLSPTDPARVPSADLTGEQWDMRAINAAAAHRITEGRRDVVVGVLDSGVDPRHPDLAGAMDAGDSAGCLTGAADPRPAAWQPTTSVHGTHVAASSRRPTTARA